MFKARIEPIGCGFPTFQTHTQKKGARRIFFSLNLNEKVNDKPRKAAAAS